MLEAAAVSLPEAEAWRPPPERVEAPARDGFEYVCNFVPEDESEDGEESQESPSDGAQGCSPQASEKACASEAGLTMALDAASRERRCRDSARLPLKEAAGRSLDELPSSSILLRPPRHGLPIADLGDSLTGKGAQLRAASRSFCRMASRSFGPACAGA